MLSSIQSTTNYHQNFGTLIREPNINLKEMGKRFTQEALKDLDKGLKGNTPATDTVITRNIIGSKPSRREDSSRQPIIPKGK